MEDKQIPENQKLRKAQAQQDEQASQLAESAAMRERADQDLDVILFLTIFALALILWLRPTQMLPDTTRPLMLRTLVMLLSQFGLMGFGVLVVMLRRREPLSRYGLKKAGLWKSIPLSLVAFLPLFALYLYRGIQTYTPMVNVLTIWEWLQLGFPNWLIGVLPTILVWGVVQAFCYGLICDKLNISDPVQYQWLQVGPIYCGVFYLVLHGYGFSLAKLPDMLLTFLTIWGLLHVRRLSQGNSWGMVLVFSLLMNAFLV